MINIEQLIINEEGLRLKAYKDTLGNWTCGVGHCLKSDCGIVSLKLVGEWLAEDLGIARKSLLRNIPCYPHLNEDRQYVLLSMCFNLGITKLLKFKKFLLALENKEYSIAAQEMKNSLWAKQVKGRAEFLANCMLKGKIKEN